MNNGQPAPPAGIAVLLVDDDADHSAAVKRTLERQGRGFKVTHAADGFACLEALAREPYAVVLLDYSLPRMNGLEVLERIRKLGVAVPVVMATGQGDERVAVEAMDAGAIDYVIKTSGYFATLPTVLNKVLKQHELALDNERLYAESRRQQTRLAQIFESTSDGIVLIDVDGRVVCANRRVGELLDFDPGLAIGLRLVDVVARKGSGGLDGRAVEAFWAILAAPTQGAGDLEIGGGRRVLHWSAQPTGDGAGAPIGLTLTFQDVTREREISRMKSDFVSFVAHQLRTPLSGIKWMLEVASEEPELSPALGSYIGDAAVSADRLIDFVNDVLDISRLESGSLTTIAEETDLGALTRDVLDDLGPLIQEKDQHLSVSAGDGGPSVLVDPKLLREAIFNLVSNAVKYTPPHGEIAIRLRTVADRVQWAIEDNGIGIPKDAEGQLFEKFYRADNASTVDAEGKGLGLYLVRLIIERFGGRIEWTSGEGRGTTFTFTLPLGRQAWGTTESES